MSQAVKITDPKVSEFPGIKNMLLVVADPITGRLYRKTLVREITLNADGSIVIPADSMLKEIVVLPQEDLLLKIGTTPGSEDILPETAIDNAGAMLVLNMYLKEQREFFLSGIAPNTLLKLITF